MLLLLVLLLGLNPSPSFSQEHQAMDVLSSDPSKWSPQELRVIYSAMLRDKERAHWQPSRSRPLAPLQTTPLGVLRHSSDFHSRQLEIPIHADESIVERRSIKERRAPGDALSFEQWGGMIKTMDNLRKPRFG